MKVIFEFDTDKEGCDLTELYELQNAREMAFTLSEIQNKIKGWDNYDDRDSIPTYEIYEEINEIIYKNVNMEKLGY